MNPSNLDEALRARARESADAILSAARADAERIAADADRVIEERRNAVLNSREDEYRAEARAGVASERHDAMRAVLLAKTRVIERVLQRARALLSESIASEAYRNGLERELAQALGFIGDEKALVRCSESLAPALRQTLRSNPDVSVEVADDVGTGFVAFGSDGRVRVDSTLETRLDRLAPVLAIEIHQRMEER
jgi:vacuolar-type H+-ATPase subunit E/Vma4